MFGCLIRSYASRLAIAIAVENQLSIKLANLKKYKPVTFFSAIQKIYEDPSIGRIEQGYFHTSSGSRFANSSKGSGVDLRRDPFQLGGQLASQEIPRFVKLEVVWPKVDGVPLVNLKGGAEMFNEPEKNLVSCEVRFSTNWEKPCDFLVPVLHNAYWGPM